MKQLLRKFKMNPFGEKGLVGADLSEVLFVVMDTETTGLDPYKDRILSIGVLKLQQGRIRIREACERFVHQDHFDHRSVPIHGILKKGADQRLPEKEVLTELLEYVQGSVIVGHHIRFDLEMIRQALLRNGLPALNTPYLDTGILYKKTILKSPLLREKEHYSLDELAKRFDLSGKDRHTALGDAYITAIVFLRILGQLRQKKDISLKQLLRMGG